MFIRCDLSVPIEDGRITDDTRIRASIPGCQARARPGRGRGGDLAPRRPTEGELKPGDSLAPVAARLADLLKTDVPLVRDWVNGVDVKPGKVVILENCRVNKGEKKRTMRVSPGKSPPFAMST